MLTTSTGIMLFLGYAVFIIVLVVVTKKKRETADDFLVMERSLGLFRGSLSMAVSWIWAPAVFICSLKSFTQGLPGIFWFTAPNILCFFVFAVFAVRLRDRFPDGYTIAEAFRLRFGERRTHLAALVVAFGYQLGAVIINCVAGATLINLLSGIPYHVGVLMMGGLALSYSLISGLRASVVSDVAQMLMVLVIALFLVPWAVGEAGGISKVTDGFAGVTGEFGNLFDPWVAYSFGIATTIGLISGPVADQMFSQRAFAAKRQSIVPIFVIAGLVFGIVPIVLSIFGFIGAAEVRAGNLVVDDAQMVGPVVVGHLLPTWALGLFAIMAFAGLTSTLDSAFSAIGSLSSIDLPNRPDRDTQDSSRLLSARMGMALFAILGIGIALLRPQLLWVFLVYGALAASLFFPAFLMLFWQNLTSSGAFWGIVAGLVVGTPLSIYANISGNTHLIVASALLGLIVAGLAAAAVSIASRSEQEANHDSRTHP